MEYKPNIELPEEKEEAPPSWFKKMLDSIVDTMEDPKKIFTPKQFESPELYEKLGIRTFKKYLPTTGDLMYKYVWKKLGESDQVTLKPDSVEKALNTTRAVEITHYAFLAIFSMYMYDYYESGNMTMLAVTTTLNALVNVYPIMLQRYNRMRLIGLKNKIEKRSQEKKQP